MADRNRHYFATVTNRRGNMIRLSISSGAMYIGQTHIQIDDSSISGIKMLSEVEEGDKFIIAGYVDDENPQEPIFVTTAILNKL